MSKHEQVEDKRSRRVIGGIFGSVALAGIFAIGGFLLGNATADSAMGADTTDVVAQPAGSCVTTPETAMYLATFLQKTGGVVVDPAAETSVGAEELTLASDSGSGTDTGTSFDTVVTGNGDGGTGTPGVTPDPTPVPDPTVTPDPTPPVDPTPEAEDDCDHDHDGNHEHDGDHEHDSHHEDSEQHSGDC